MTREDIYRYGNERSAFVPTYKNHPPTEGDYNALGVPVLRWEDAVHRGCGGAVDEWKCCTRCGADLTSADVERRREA